MKLSKGSCHICLDDKIYVVGNDRSKCQNDDCHGYICNMCWNDLISNDINSCPICRMDIDEEYIDNKTKNKLSMWVILLHTLSVIMGFVVITGVYLMCDHNINDYSKSINLLSRLEFILFIFIVDIVGIVCMCIILTMYFRCSNK
jgi:hypothetical protein